MATAAQPGTGMRAVMALPDFRKLWLAQFVSIFGDFIALFAVISLITFRWHGNAAQITYVVIAYWLPLAIVTPVAGVFVDRWNVQRVMVASDIIRGLLVLLLPWVTDLTQVCAIFAALSCVSSFFSPAQSVLVRTIVPMEQLLGANAMLSQAFYIVRLLSPVAAGSLVAAVGEHPCFYLDSASFFFSGAMISLMVVNRTAVAGNKSLRGFFADLTSGNRFIFTHPALAFVITAMLTAMFVMSCVGPLFSIYVRDILNSGTFLYGIVSSMVGVGLIGGTQFVTRFARNRSKQSVVLSGLVIAALGIGLLGASRVVAAAIPTTFLMGFGLAFVIVSSQTLVQTETPREMVGRVSSSFMSVFSFAQVFGLLLSGKLAVWLGIRPVFVVCGGALALIAMLGYWRHAAITSAAQASAAAG